MQRNTKSIQSTPARTMATLQRRLKLSSKVGYLREGGFWEMAHEEVKSPRRVRATIRAINIGFLGRGGAPFPSGLCWALCRAFSAGPHLSASLCFGRFDLEEFPAKGTHLLVVPFVSILSLAFAQINCGFFNFGNIYRIKQ